jgi:ubiquinone/menaquinone biosynthesis C-methylase UbiE
MAISRTQQVGQLFDVLAPTYDQVGVDFFQPIANRLVELLDPRPGERAVDLGCGRGAVTVPLAHAVGPDGSVLAGDVSGAMVEATRQVTAELTQVRADDIDAAEPNLPAHSANLVAASLVIFFLPDPAAALRSWVEVLVPGGRVGLTTFGPQDDVWKSVDALFDPYLPPDMLDARTSGVRGPYASSDATSELLRSAGLTSVDTVVEPLTVPFEDAETWQRWTMSVGQRRMWGFVPEAERPVLFARAAALLETARDADGAIRLRQDVRYSVGIAPLS